MPDGDSPIRSTTKKQRTARWRRVVIAVALLVLAQCVLAYVLFFDVSPGALLAEQWKRDLNSLSEKKAVQHIHDMALQGDAAMPNLVLALTSRRDSIVDAARRELRRLLDMWEMRDAKAASANVAQLARLLANHAEEFSHRGRAAAGSLATQILLWPLDAPGVEVAQVIRDCETVLRSFGATEHQSLVTAGVDAADSDVKPPVVPNLHAPPSPSDLMTALSQIPPLPSPEFKPVGRPELHDEPLPRNTIANRPRMLVPNIPESGLQPNSPSPGEFSPPARAINRLPTEGNPNIANLDLIDVMRQLHSEDGRVAEAADRELTRRNLSSVARQVALRITDSEPSVRLELARRLPRVNGIDPTEWLLWLARDEDTRVRQEALAILATSRDPQVRDTVRRLLETESNPRILERMTPEIRR